MDMRSISHAWSNHNWLLLISLDLVCWRSPCIARSPRSSARWSMNLMRFFHASTCSIMRYDRLLIRSRYGKRPASCAKTLDLGRFPGSLSGAIALVARLLMIFMRGWIYAAPEASCSLAIAGPSGRLFVIFSFIVLLAFGWEPSCLLLAPRWSGILLWSPSCFQASLLLFWSHTSNKSESPHPAPISYSRIPASLPASWSKRELV